MGSFKQFCQQGPLEEGLLSRVTSFFKKPKKQEKPQLVPTKKANAYRTHDDIDPADIPEFKPSFTVKKEEELDEDCGVDKMAPRKPQHTKDKNDKKEFFKKFSQFRKLFSEKYSNPKMGADKHLTLTNKKKKGDQILVDFPGKEWHKMKKGVVTKVGDLPEGRYQGHDNPPKGTVADGENRKIRKSLKPGTSNPSKAKYYISKVRERKQKRYGGSGLLGNR